jgi:Flp pilus assembly protein TadB
MSTILAIILSSVLALALAFMGVVFVIASKKTAREKNLEKVIEQKETEECEKAPKEEYCDYCDTMLEPGKIECSSCDAKKKREITNE